LRQRGCGEDAAAVGFQRRETSLVRLLIVDNLYRGERESVKEWVRRRYIKTIESE
jgi:hypothetical protein